MGKPTASGKPFVILCFAFRKPKPWRRNVARPKAPKQLPGVMIKKVTTYLKCLNASKMLIRSFDERHAVSKWNEERPFPFLKRNMEICVNAWSLYEDRLRSWIGARTQGTSQMQLTQFPAEKYTRSARNNEDEEDGDSFLAAIDRIPLSPSPSPLFSDNQPSTSRAAAVAAVCLNRGVSDCLFQAVFRGEEQSLSCRSDTSAKQRGATTVDDDDKDVMIDYVVEEPPESIASSTDCRELNAPTVTTRKKSLTSHDRHRPPLAKAKTVNIGRTFLATNLKTPTLRTRSVQQIARSVKRSDIVSYSDSDSENDATSKAAVNEENELTPMPHGRFRARRIIRSPTTEERKRAVAKKVAKRSASMAVPLRRSPRVAKAAVVRVKVEADDELVDQSPVTRNAPKRRSVRLDNSCVSAATADTFTPPPATRRRTMLAIEAPTSPAPKSVARKKRWNKTEMDRLKDWEKIANSISAGERSAAECREQAVKLRYWNPPADENGGGDAESKPRQPSNSKADFFADKSYGDMTLLGLDPDDSLLSVLKTPTEPVKYTRKPPLLRQIINETIYSTRSSFNDSL